MDGAAHATVPLRVGKKMRKRRELDALGGRGGRLLSASSDEGEPWGRRSARRRRTRPLFRLAAALGLCVCVVSAATVLWLFVDVRRQIVSLRFQMDGVSTSSSHIDDELQSCHTAAKELRANVSELSTRLLELEKYYKDLEKKVSDVAGELAAVSQQLADAPKLADMPRRLMKLQEMVANFGSQINGFDGALTSARKQAATATSGLEEVRTSLHQLEARTNETISNSSANSQKDEELRQQINALNSTLAARIDSLQTAIAESAKTSNSTPLTTSSTTSTSTTPSTTTSGPVTKPNVTQ